MNVRTIIFDLDGTLIDSSDGVVEAVNYALRQVGEPERSPEIIKPYIGYPLETMFADFTDVPVTELRHHFQVCAVDTVVSSAVLLDHVESTLSELHRRGHRMAIATTKIRFHVDGIIDKFGWRDLFAAAVAGDEVPRVKPDPDAFLLALERLQSRAAESLVVGDTVNDVLAAQAVPLRVVAVRSPYGGGEKLAALQPDFFINDLPELVTVLDALEKE